MGISDIVQSILLNAMTIADSTKKHTETGIYHYALSKGHLRLKKAPTVVGAVNVKRTIDYFSFSGL